MFAEQVVRLASGRRLAYLDSGRRNGTPVIHCHGAPSGKLETTFFDLHAAAQNAARA